MHLQHILRPIIFKTMNRFILPTMNTVVVPILWNKTRELLISFSFLDLIALYFNVRKRANEAIMSLDTLRPIFGLFFGGKSGYPLNGVKLSLFVQLAMISTYCTKLFNISSILFKYGKIVFLLPYKVIFAIFTASKIFPEAADVIDKTTKLFNFDYFAIFLFLSSFMWNLPEQFLNILGSIYKFMMNNIYNENLPQNFLYPVDNNPQNINKVISTNEILEDNKANTFFIVLALFVAISVAIGWAPSIKSYINPESIETWRQNHTWLTTIYYQAQYVWEFVPYHSNIESAVSAPFKATYGIWHYVVEKPIGISVLILNKTIEYSIVKPFKFCKELITPAEGFTTWFTWVTHGIIPWHAWSFANKTNSATRSTAEKATSSASQHVDAATPVPLPNPTPPTAPPVPKPTPPIAPPVPNPNPKPVIEVNDHSSGGVAATIVSPQPINQGGSTLANRLEELADREIPSLFDRPLSQASTSSGTETPRGITPKPLTQDELIERNRSTSPITDEDFEKINAGARAFTDADAAIVRLAQKHLESKLAADKAKELVLSGKKEMPGIMQTITDKSIDAMDIF